MSGDVVHCRQSAGAGRMRWLGESKLPVCGNRPQGQRPIRGLPPTRETVLIFPIVNLGIEFPGSALSGTHVRESIGSARWPTVAR